eukprot:TRINITY_DN1398_c0_g1_i2.p1 TRINITY_DN1398_c0_g1~~TRINITY_DN1398_c0_g1_i2.p1  ORF type:complete len:665 (+),score=106.57 TRINITY_DN1398_c0_g1_i2:8551-10545(+)
MLVNKCSNAQSAIFFFYLQFFRRIVNNKKIKTEMQKNQDGSNVLLAIVEEQLKVVIEENKGFYEENTDGVKVKNKEVVLEEKSEVPPAKPNLRQSRYEVAQTEQKDGGLEVQKSSIVPEKSIDIKSGAKDLSIPIKRPSAKHHKSKMVQFSNDPVSQPKKPVPRVEPAAKVEEPQKKDPINANIKDSFDEEDDVNLSPENPKESQKDDDDFDYAFDPAPKNPPDKVSVGESTRPYTACIEKSETDSDESEKLQSLLKENISKRPKTAAAGQDVILEEGEDNEDSEVLDSLPLVGGEQQNPGIAKLIEDELSTVKHKEDTKNDKENEKKLREMKEEAVKIKLKEEKLKETAMGGVFMNNLAIKAKAPIKLPQTTVKEEEQNKHADHIQEETKLVEKSTKQVEGETDNWDKINEQRNAELEERENSDSKVENLTYETAWETLSTQDLSKELPLIVREDTRRLNIFQKLFAGCLTRFKLDKNLHKERDTILALMKVKVKDDFHQLMLMRIFQLISAHAPEGEAKNWVLIGFQGANPETDIRGSGMFGVLQVHFFAEKFPDLMKRYFLLSIDESQKFPLVVIMFSFTVMAAEALREGILTTMCNKAGSVIKVMNRFYAATFNRLMERWEKEKLVIIDWDRAYNECKSYCKDHAKEVIDEFMNVTGHKY